MSAYRSDEGARVIREAQVRTLEHWPVPNERHFVPTPEGDTFVIVSGPVGAPSLMLIHGSGSSSAHWIDRIPFLAKHFRVYAVDVIGEPGLSAPSRPPLNSDAYARWLDALLDHFELTDAQFMGYSFGGWLTLDYAIRRPQRVNRMSLFCPMGIGKQKYGFLLATILLSPFGRWGQRKALSITLGSELPKMPEDRFTATSDQIRLVSKHFRYRTGFPIFTDEDLRGLTMPMQVAVGDEDAMVDSVETASRLASTSSRAEVHLLPGIGHLLPTRPEQELEFLIREEQT